MKGRLTSPVFWLVILILAVLMLRRDKAVPKRIAGWLNRAGAEIRKVFAGLGAGSGMTVYKSIAAVVFIFRPVGDEDRFTLRSCSGWVEYAGRFHESRAYEFALDCRLTAGNAEVLLMDGERKEMLRLNPASPAGRAELNAKSRYYVRWEFREASGKCGLRW